MILPKINNLEESRSNKRKGGIELYKFDMNFELKEKKISKFVVFFTNV